MPEFQYIQLLWLLALLPVLAGVYFYARQKKKKVFKQLGDEALVMELTASYNRSSFWKKFTLMLAAMALILVSVANLRSPEGSEKITRNGIDIMIAIDVSKSMMAEDIKPTRLDRAKQLLNRLMDRLSNDRIGIVVFAGKAYLQMPLTADHSAAKMYLSAATPETVPTQGTVIADALKMCFASFNAKEKKYKAIILISDGEDHDEKANGIAEQMAAEGVVINTVGIGSPQGAPIMDPVTNQLKKDEAGNTVITKLNEQALMDIADKGNGSYQLYTNTDAVVQSLYEQLATLDKRNVTDNSLMNYKSWFQYLLGAAFLFLLLELFISEVKKVSRGSIKLAVAILFGLISFSAAAQTTDKEIIKNGNDAYKRGEFQAAAADYSKAVQKNDANTTAQFNLGNALFRSDKKQDALGAYEKAQSKMTKPGEKSSALYNKGVIEQGDEKKLEDCILSYKNALKTNPDNEDARHNLQLALKKQKEQQQKKDQEKKDQEKKKPDDKKDQQPKPKPSNISQKDAEQKLQALMQKEKDLQDKLHKVNASSPNKPEKDW